MHRRNIAITEDKCHQYPDLMRTFLTENIFTVLILQHLQEIVIPYPHPLKIACWNILCI